MRTWSSVGGALLVVGCSAAHVVEVHEDVGIQVSDVGVDAAIDGGELTASCPWWGYGTACPVSCSSPPDVEFRAVPTFWGNGYCCDAFPGEVWEHCVCVNGRAVCPNGPRDPNPGDPYSRCEFCNSQEDAALYDAGVSDDAAADAP